MANKIYDEMIDFAKYAFNKSHAAAYAVVAYQTAFLKYYYPVEFMAALMTSVIDNPSKVSEYILSSRRWESTFSPLISRREKVPFLWTEVPYVTAFPPLRASEDLSLRDLWRRETCGESLKHSGIS